MQLRLDHRLGRETAAQRHRFRQAAACAMLVGATGVLLLGLSGWFLTAAALAGLVGPAAALGFNYMLPAAGIRFLAISRTVSRYGERLAGHAAALRVGAGLRERVFRAALAIPVGQALSISTGEASSHLAEDVAAIEGALVRRTGSWQLGAAAAAGVAVMSRAGWAPVIVLAGFLLGLLLLVHIATRRVARLGRRVQREVTTLKREVAMLAGAAIEIRAYRLDAWASERIGLHARSLEEAQRRATTALGRLDALIPATVATAAPLALLTTAHSGAAIAALATLAAMMAIDGAAAWVRGQGLWGEVDAADERLDALLAEPLASRNALRTPPGRHIPPTSIALQTGARTAIIGASGSGKTTIVETLLGLRDTPSAGISLDGIDVSLLGPEALRATFAWCPQDAALIDGTVRDNLLLAAPQADEAALWLALADACLIDRVKQGGGLDSQVGENGCRLSGGERRRLALARAYLAPARCLLLDEPTEGLDAATDAQVVQGLDQHLRRTGKGLILVSHRPAPLMLTDRAVRLDAGDDMPRIAA